jgi:hypothetical protein
MCKVLPTGLFKQWRQLRCCHNHDDKYNNYYNNDHDLDYPARTALPRKLQAD